MKAGLLALSLLFFQGLIETQAAQENNNEKKKLFGCHKPINPYDPNFEQGQERFLDVYIEGGNQSLSLDYYDMAGSIELVPQENRPSYLIGADFTTFTSQWQDGLLSMVFLGNGYWGAFLKQGLFEQELLCRELIRLEDL